MTEIVPPVDPSGGYPYTPGQAYGPAAPVWEYLAPNPTDFYSNLISGAERLPNGNTLATSGFQDWIFEVGLGDQIVWSETITRTFKARRYDYALFAQPQQMSVASGGTAALNVVAGSEHAGRLYWVLGTTAGTSPGLNVQGFDVPLNPIGAYFTITSNLGALSGSFGTLDALGNAQATLPVPPAFSPGLVGVVAHHAFAVFDPAGVVHAVSEARALELVP